MSWSSPESMGSPALSYLDGGPWTAEDHARHPSYDWPLMRAILANLRPPAGWNGAHVLDLGCGLGYYLAALAPLGATCVGVEPEPMGQPAELWQQVRASIADPDLDIPQGLFGWADLVLCLEVLEHLPLAEHPAAFENIARALAPDGVLVFSAAHVGQGGQGHIAERPEDEWIRELADRGLWERSRFTLALRAAAEYPWHRQNVMVWQWRAQRAQEDDQ